MKIQHLGKPRGTVVLKFYSSVAEGLKVKVKNYRVPNPVLHLQELQRKN